MLKETSNASEYELAEMELTLKTIKAGNIYAKIESVSRSGMSRRMSFYLVTNENKIQNVTPFVAWLCGDVKIGEYKQGGKWLNEDGLRVGGCGMDMIFHTLYNCMPYEEAKNWNQNYNRL